MDVIIGRQHPGDHKAGFYGDGAASFYDGGFFGIGRFVQIDPEQDEGLYGRFNRMLYNRTLKDGEDDGSQG